MAHWDTQADEDSYITPEQWEAGRTGQEEAAKALVAEFEAKAWRRARELMSELATLARSGASEAEILDAIESADREVNPGDYFDGE